MLMINKYIARGFEVTHVHTDVEFEINPLRKISSPTKLEIQGEE